MHLYLRENPRTLYLITSSQEEIHGKPGRVLVVRAAEHDPSRIVVEFLFKTQADLTNVVRLTSRVVKGCLGIIPVNDGTYSLLVTGAIVLLPTRYLSCCDNFSH